jgi:fatty acid desaturase
MDIEPTARELLPRDTLRRLARRSNYRGLLQLGLHVGLLVGTGFVVWASRAHSWLTAALVVHGIVISFLFCALHESIHRTVSVRLLTWRMSYHAEHHSFPSVPFHALAELNALMGRRVRVTAPGYLAVHRELLRRVLDQPPAPRARCR